MILKVEFKKINRDNKGTTKYELKTDGVFIAIGHIPNTTIFKGQLDLDKNNFIIPNNITHNFLEGKQLL